MYRQILVHVEDRKYQNILWRENKNENIKTFRLNTITYGTAPASFLATRTLKQLSIDEVNTHPNAAKVMATDFYMDDLLTGTQTFEEAQDLRDEIIKLSIKGNLLLRKWASNAPELIKNLNENAKDTNISLNIDDKIKTLGLYWYAKDDTLTYVINNSFDNNIITKRTILSSVAKLFDPLGLLGPIIVRAKIFMQFLWQIKADWDDPLPSSICFSWMQYNDELSLLNKVQIPRKVILRDIMNIEIHGFCDASEKAYGACLYIKTTNNSNISHVQLLCAKSKVAPLKTITLPRLELCAALLLSRLFSVVKSALRDIKFKKIYFWSDSTIALNWIITPPHTLKTFVANRVTEIQELTAENNWHFVSSGHNPADLISRGLSPAEFLSNELWKSGPTWLKDNKKNWPLEKLKIIEVPEKKTKLNFKVTCKQNEILNKFSNFTKLLRIVALCWRFYNNINKKNVKKTPYLDAQEIKYASNCIIKLIQNETFHKEITEIKKHGIVKGNLSSLSPFLDNDGILRVGGRLAKANLNFAQRHQALLPKRHHITDIIIINTHEKLFHADVQSVLNALRNKYWIKNGIQYIKGIIHKCVICNKLKPTIPNYIMGNLPSDRVNYARPFFHVGVDFCGPIFIKEKRFRNTKRLKIFLAVFVCFSTKAVHLELVEDLTTEAFLAALRLFFARRGRSSDIYSDNATNFVGVKRQVDEINNFLSDKDNLINIRNNIVNGGTRWHLIPLRAPHFGGLWEAVVKSVKHHLLHVVKQTLLTYQALLTYVIDIEAILNSRPITSLSSDPNDLNALTPGHFLIGEPFTSLPDNIYENTLKSSNWKHLEQLRRHFWTRWKNEYLHTLTLRQKWHNKAINNIQEGTLVILKENNIPPLQWRLGRIIATHPGEDGVVRVVTIRTLNGEYKRPVKGVAPLPIKNVEPDSSRPAAC